MSTSTAIREIPNLLVNKQKTISFETFQKKYNNRADGFKYEWNEGVVEKSRATTTRELFIIEILVDFFYTLKKKVGGILTSEVEQWTTTSKFRKPDLAYFTKAQIKEGRADEKPLSKFMIELISNNDQINMVNDKVLEYFEAGVKVVWLIFPNQEMVYVYTSPTEVKICKNDIICSAESVIEGFSIKAGDIFKEI
jgi:Uma2 family endonuclease